MQKSKRLQMAEGKYFLKHPVIQGIYKPMQHRPELKIQSGIFNKSHLDTHTEVQVFLYPKVTWTNLKTLPHFDQNLLQFPKN